MIKLVYFKPLKVLAFAVIHYNSNRTARAITMALKLPLSPFLSGPGTTSKACDIQGMEESVCAGTYSQKYNFLVGREHGWYSFPQEHLNICCVACGFDINTNNLNAIIILLFDCISLVNQWLHSSLTFKERVHAPYIKEEKVGVISKWGEN